MFRLFKRANQLNLITIDLFAEREDKLYPGDYSFCIVHNTFGLFLEKGFIEKKYPNTSRGIYILTDKGREYAISQGYFDEK
jgi:hypothetical protein